MNTGPDDSIARRDILRRTAGTVAGLAALFGFKRTLSLIREAPDGNLGGYGASTYGGRGRKQGPSAAKGPHGA